MDDPVRSKLCHKVSTEYFLINVTHHQIPTNERRRSPIFARSSTRVSNELGAGNPKRALLAVYVVLGMTVVVGTVVATVLISIRNVWGYAYSDEIQVVRYVAVMLPIVAASNFLDGLQCVLSGNARGCGWQKIGAFVNLGSYYLLGIPCSILLAFVVHVGGKVIKRTTSTLNSTESYARVRARDVD